MRAESPSLTIIPDINRVDWHSCVDLNWKRLGNIFYCIDVGCIYIFFPPFTSHAADTFSFSHVVLNNIAAFTVVSLARTNRGNPLGGAENQKETLKMAQFEKEIQIGNFLWKLVLRLFSYLDTLTLRDNCISLLGSLFIFNQFYLN